MPNGTIGKYKTCEGWKDFLYIEEELPSNISGLENTNKKEPIRFGLDGRMIIAPRKGINIIKHFNGKVQKVLVR